MLYAIVGHDTPNSLEKRLASRPEHVKRLRELQKQGRLLLAGPFPAVDGEDPGNAGYTGSLIVAEFPSLEEAQAWAAEDPYTISGVYGETTVRPFRKTLPE
ncbi:MAG: YciI family protein [Gallionellaceae bacterium]|jgi:uncharacterized protein YciI|nr:YciI family protein [Gallionellaceae bacterium]